MADSDLEGEFDEMLLKSNVLVHTILSTKDPKHTREHGVTIAGVPTALKAATNRDDASVPGNTATRKMEGKALAPPPVEGFSTEDFLVSLPSGGTEFGLEPLKKALFFLGNPQNAVPFIHVTSSSPPPPSAQPTLNTALNLKNLFPLGTNGKGSVCSTLTCILKNCGHNVGRFISPHLVDWRESVTKNDEYISTLLSPFPSRESMN